MINTLVPVCKPENNHDLLGSLKSLEAECRTCKPSSPLQCINRCQVYKLKNELRHLRETMSNPNYLKELFNALKNTTRLHILQTIVNRRCTLRHLQMEIKKTGHVFNRDAICEEYLRPLILVGLATEVRDEYTVTMFGSRLTKELGRFPKFAEQLPAHSECYEETTLPYLLSGPKTFEEIEAILPQKTVPRTLKRLHSKRLIKNSGDKSYIFFFKSKRDYKKEAFTTKERKIYDAIPIEGISAGRLAKETRLSIRLTYKYLRRLRGKKLAFSRRTPKTYSLTFEGKKLALVLQKIQRIVEDTWVSSEQIMQNAISLLKEGDLSNHAFLR